MEPFTQHRGVAAPILRSNIDTDAIIPSREMKRVSKSGLGAGLFADERYLDAATRERNPDFVLNKSAYENCTILLSGANFGCGSSREHAVWALHEFGIRALIAPSFGVIFANNCIRNGLLPIALEPALIDDLVQWVEASPADNLLAIDLEVRSIQAGALRLSFAIDEGGRHMLLNGLDAIALTQTRQESIARFHADRQKSRPWLYAT